MRRATAVALVSTLLLAAPTAAHDDSRPEVPTIRVAGMGRASGAPDRAEIDLGVVTEAKDAVAASKENAKRLDAVIRALRKILPSDAEVKTVQYSVSPRYRYGEGRPPEIEGYTATNVVRVRTDELGDAGSLVDSAIAAGANNVQGIRFMVKDEKTLRAEALREATEEAMADARAIAKALDVKLGRVRQVDTGGPIRPFAPEGMMRMQASAAESAPTPVAPGTIDVEATVTLAVDIE